LIFAGGDIDFARAPILIFARADIDFAGTDIDSDIDFSLLILRLEQS